MFNRKTKVFVVCEDHEYKGINKVIGLFPTVEEAEKCIRAKGKVKCWKDRFMPFALDWAQVEIVDRDYGPLDAWYWIEEQSVQLPEQKPQFFWEVIAMILGVIFLFLGYVMHGDIHLECALVLIGCVAAVGSFGSAFLKA